MTLPSMVVLLVTSDRYRPCDAATSFVLLENIERIHTVDMLHAIIAGCNFETPCPFAQLCGTAVSFILAIRVILVM